MKGVSANASIILTSEAAKLFEKPKRIDGPDALAQWQKSQFELKREYHESKETPKLRDHLYHAYTNLVNGIPIRIIQGTFAKTGIDGDRFKKGEEIGIRMTYPIKEIGMTKEAKKEQKRKTEPL